MLWWIDGDSWGREWHLIHIIRRVDGDRQLAARVVLPEEGRRYGLCPVDPWHERFQDSGRALAEGIDGNDATIHQHEHRRLATRQDRIA